MTEKTTAEQGRRFFSMEQIEEMERFLERVIDGAMAARSNMKDSVAGNYADEINEQLMDARIDLRDLRLMAKQKMEHAAAVRAKQKARERAKKEGTKV